MSVDQVKQQLFGCWSIEAAAHLVLVKWNCQNWSVDHVKQQCFRFWPSYVVEKVVDQVIWTILCVGQVKLKMLIMWYAFKMCWSSDTKSVDQVINQSVGQMIHQGVDQVKFSRNFHSHTVAWRAFIHLWRAFIHLLSHQLVTRLPWGRNMLCFGIQTFNSPQKVATIWLG